VSEAGTKPQAGDVTRNGFQSEPRAVRREVDLTLDAPDGFSYIDAPDGFSYIAAHGRRTQQHVPASPRVATSGNA